MVPPEGVRSRKLTRMSDRSGVGAPTHDGADPGPTDQGASADTADGGRAPSVRSRLGRDLFAAALGAEPATDATPPGVPDTGSTARRDADARTEPARDAAPDAGTAESVGRSLRRRLTTRDEVVVDDADLLDVSTPDDVIDSSVDPGVVPVEEPPRRPSRRGGLRARRVHRIIRRVDPWSVLKMCLVFYFCVWLMVVVSGVLIWGVAVGSGTVDSLENFIEGLMAFEEFHFNADQIFRLFAMGGLILVFLGTAISAILAVLFNLISDLIGGIRITVVEEESTRRIVTTK